MIERRLTDASFEQRPLVAADPACRSGHLEERVTSVFVESADATERVFDMRDDQELMRCSRCGRLMFNPRPVSSASARANDDVHDAIEATADRGGAP